MQDEPSDNYAAFDDLWIAQEDDGDPVMGFALTVQLWLENTHTNEMRNAILQALTDYQSVFPEQLTHYLRKGQKRPSPMGDKGFEAAYRAEIDALDPEYDAWGPLLLAEDPIDPYGAEAIAAEEDEDYPLGAFSARFPCTYTRDNLEAIVTRILGWCNLLRPAQGTVGIAPIFEPGMRRAYPKIYWPMISRFNGLDFNWAFNIAAADNRGIKGVNWLTILDAAYVDALGGRDKVVADLGGTAEVLDWDGGVLIRAGHEPQIGDTNMDEWPAAYMAVNRVLKPIRFEDYEDGPPDVFEVPEPQDSYEETLNWVRRFDRDE